MKTKTFLCLCLFLGIGLTKMPAQTYQYDLHGKFEGLLGWCLNKPVSGEFLYHFTYQIDKKTGFICRVHWNIKQANVYDTETGEKYIVIDTGSDNLGIWWDFYNNINLYTGGMYKNVEDGFLQLPAVLPDEGTMVNSAFKFISKGGDKYSMFSLMQLHRNANGEMVVNLEKVWADCNTD